MRSQLGVAGRVPLKDAWARIEPHGRELRRMGAHGGAWTRTTANENVPSAWTRIATQCNEQLPRYRREDCAMPLCFLIHKWLWMMLMYC